MDGNKNSGGHKLGGNFKRTPHSKPHTKINEKVLNRRIYKGTMDYLNSLSTLSGYGSADKLHIMKEFVRKNETLFKISVDVLVNGCDN